VNTGTIGFEAKEEAMKMGELVKIELYTFLTKST
jgi:hypothetical protein